MDLKHNQKDRENERVYQVLLNQNSRYIDRVYSYLYAGELSAGTVVKVPFGKGNKVYEGIVIGEDESDRDIERLKRISEVSEVSSSWNGKRLELARWIREEYLCSYKDAMMLFYPQSVRHTPSKYRHLICLTDKASLREAFHHLPGNATRKRKLYELLLSKEQVYREDLRQEMNPLPNQYLDDLVEREILCIYEEKCSKNPPRSAARCSEEILLNDLQRQVYEEMEAEIRGKNRPILLRGVTGSGKTQIYIELMKKIQAEGKGIIVLVPEISLTPQTVSRFEAAAGERLAVIHSHLSKSEKAEEWRRIEEMSAPVVIGARSALFAPVENLGLILIDECHDEAYKSEQNPKYDAIEVAQEMKRVLGCSLVLGSATPKITQYHSARSGKWHLVELLQRANRHLLPKVEIVNMIDDAKDGNLSFLSMKLRHHMDEELSKGNQVILYINRRGYAGFMTCRDCGHIPKCRHCDISLTYHKEKNVLRCHYCNYEEMFQRDCPSCASGHLEDRGMGTERIVQEVRSFFPKADVYRMDRDTVKKKGDHEKILHAFRNASSGVLVGTQMIGKGHDFPRVNLVGIIHADQGMYFPDYRSNERTFSSIEQVGGRAGRSTERGRVIIQTFSPDHHMLSHVVQHDYTGFYEEEIKLRKTYVYPPYGNLIRILVSGKDEKKTASSAMKIKDAFVFYVQKKGLSIQELYGPYPSMIARIEDRYRWQILIKDREIPMAQIKKMLNYILTEKRSVVLEKEVYAVIDINPSNMV